MARIITLNGIRPRIGANCFLADTAVLIGDVVLGDGCSVWFGAVLRGDVNSIRIGREVNIQDNAVIHTLYKQSQSVVGDRVSIGHSAIVHGAEVGPGCLIGMGATLLDHAVVGEGTIVAANSLVLSHAQLEARSVYAGVPARLVKRISPEQARDINERTARDYQMYASWFMREDALVEEVDRWGRTLSSYHPGKETENSDGTGQ